MDIIESGCSFLALPFLPTVMDLAGEFGHGALLPMVGLALLGWGLWFKDRKCVRMALALVLSAAIAGIIAEGLKELFQLPRPRRETAGFPSGHASASFSFAAVLANVFPNWAGLFYLLATMTGISRLYFRAHFIRDVVAGAVIGFTVGSLITKWLVAPLPKKSRFQAWAWIPSAGLALAPLMFFAVLESEIDAHKLSGASVALSSAPVLVVDFDGTKPGGGNRALEEGEAETSGALRKSGNKFRFEPASSVDVSLPESGSYRFLLRLYALREKGPVCQDVGISVNGRAVTRLHLEKGWHWYEFKPAASSLRAGVNKVLFDYGGETEQLPKQDGGNGLRKSLVFDRLMVARD